ncbi:MAG: phosphoribosyl-AMP cyclohydrolase [Novosphingobium sp.]
MTTPPCLAGQPPSCTRYFPDDDVKGKGEASAAWILPRICGYPATSNFRQLTQIEGLMMADSQSADREQGTQFLPKYDTAGLLTAVAVDASDGTVLMLAHMDAEALRMTQETGFAHFHSRSRGRLWKKGESSGHVLKVSEILVDCDQDALVLRCEPAGPACHTLAPSCFYRKVDGNSLTRI